MAIYDLTVSLDLKQNLNIYTTCKQLDSINLICSIYDNSVQADLTNYNVRLKAMKADSIPLIQEYTGISIPADSNVVTIAADEQLTTTAGEIPIELQFIDKTSGKKKATFNLILEVMSSTLVVDRSISTATYTLLEELENKLDQTSDFFENISEAVEINNELKTSIASGSTLKTGLDMDIVNGNTLKTGLENSTAAANTAKSNLENSISNANTAKSAVDASNTNAQVTKSALEADIAQAQSNSFAAEITNARGTYQTLKARLDANDTSLSDKANQIAQLSNPNLLINGDFQVWQRGTSFNSSGVYYSTDRWRIDAGGGTNSITKQYDDTFKNFIRISTNQYANLWYQMEDADLNKIKGKQITLSFYARKLSGNFVNAVYRVSNVSDAVNNNANNFTTEWKKFTIATTIPIDATALNLGLVNFYTGQNGSTVVYDIAQVKLELGSIATPFIPRLYAQELALCQRYYQAGGVTPQGSAGVNFGGYVVSGIAYHSNIKFKGTMRTTPTVVLTNLYNSNLSNTPTLIESSEEGFIEERIATATGQGRSISIFTADAEIY